MNELSTSSLSRFRRRRERGSHDRALIESVLDAALVCHVGFVIDGKPVVLPTIHARIGDQLYLHGAAASRMLGAIEGAPACVTVTHVDGLVLARSAFHHSMNYRSVVLFGNAREVTDANERRRALDAIVEHVTPGRSGEVRPPSPTELAATRVVAMPIGEGSAKVRTGPPIDDAEDHALPHWAGVVPLRVACAAPEPAPELDANAPTPRHVWRLLFAGEPVRERRFGELVLSNDRGRIDLDALHARSPDVSRRALERAIRSSLCAGAYDGQQMVGFARVVTDQATFAKLCELPDDGELAEALLDLLRADLDGVPLAD